MGEQGGIAGIPIQLQLKSTGDGKAQAFVQCDAVAATKFVIASNGWRKGSPFGFQLLLRFRPRATRARFEMHFTEFDQKLKKWRMLPSHDPHLRPNWGPFEAPLLLSRVSRS